MLENDNIISFIKDTVHEYDATAKVVLFGSRARGSARSDSDWDVIIIVDKERIGMSEYSEYAYPLYSAGLDMGCEINVVVYTKRQWEHGGPTLFKHNVIEEGVVL